MATWTKGVVVGIEAGGAQGLKSPAEEPSLCPTGSGEPQKAPEQGSEGQTSLSERAAGSCQEVEECLPWPDRGVVHTSEPRSQPSWSWHPSSGDGTDIER